MRELLVWVCFLVWLCMIPVMVQSCAALPDAKTQAELNKLTARVDVLGNKIVDAGEYIVKLETEIAALIEKGKRGELGAKEVAEAMSTLHERLAEAREHRDTLMTESAATKKQIEELSASGVPWWQIAIWGLLGVFNVATGRGYLKEKGNGRIADYAIQGITTLVRAIEKSSTISEAKKRVASAHHDIVEAEVLKLPIQPPKEQPPPKVAG